MVSDQWYAVRRKRDPKVVYLMCGGDRRMVEATAQSMYREWSVIKLTWMMMKVLTGCAIPNDSATTSFCRGEIMLPRKDRHDIIIKVL